MGAIINPGNEGFRIIRNDVYVDKSGLIRLMNRALDTPGKLVCSTRPRRFGKSFAALMLAAYYDRSCESNSLFADLEIAQDASYTRHLNRYNVVYLDMSSFMLSVRQGADIIDEIENAVLRDIAHTFPSVSQLTSIEDALSNVVAMTGSKFLFVIDEWDALFREDKAGRDMQERYILLLRSLFKNGNFTPNNVVGAYITGILPIKKYGTHSAMSDFREYTMLDPWEYAPYVGFTEDEVRRLCESSPLSFEEMQRWYDGYEFPDAGRVFSPDSVMNALRHGRVGSYWHSSESFEALRIYVDMDFDGLQQKILQLMGGGRVPVTILRFQNDMTSLGSVDDVLTLMCHLGYLAYDAPTKTVRIPNEEILQEFRSTVEVSRHSFTARLIADSRDLVLSTVEGDQEAVAQAVSRVHDTMCAPLFYNNEQALRSVVKLAYIAAIDDYVTIEELPAGRGYADVVFIPKRSSNLPALLVELKWNQPVQTAINQVHRRNYPAALAGFGGDLVVVCITYDKDTKVHSCVIERITL